uniref:Putative secreted protein n=1 Tax=Ixodes ricinus TaxID=34613 RepID=A0A6B0UJ35_IXORI
MSTLACSLLELLRLSAGIATSDCTTPNFATSSVATLGPLSMHGPNKDAKRLIKWATRYRHLVSSTLPIPECFFFFYPNAAERTWNRLLLFLAFFRRMLGSARTFTLAVR